MDFIQWLEDQNADDYQDEMTFVKSLLQGQSRLEDYQYYKDYAATVSKERSLIKNKTLFVGGGPFPITAILLNRMGIRCDIMEYNASAANIAHQVLEKIKQPMNIIVADARKFNGYGNYNTIMIALEAGDSDAAKKQIFDTIKTQINPNTQLIIRGSGGDGGEGAFVNVENYVHNYFQVVKKIPVFGNLSTTYVMHCSTCPSQAPMNNDMVTSHA